MSSWHAFPKVWNLGHANVIEIFDDNVLIEEKVDGSQFSFGIIEGKLKVRSKGVVMDPDGPENMFKEAVDVVKELLPLLTPGWTYRAEYLQKPKHNSLAYGRIPAKHLMIFDINTGEEQYLSYPDKVAEAQRLGLEVVPQIYYGKIDSASKILELMERTSVLGLQKIEGVVIKSYSKFGPDKKALMAKYVSEAFKEIHHKDWKDRHPTQTDILDHITDSLKTPARWEKAVQHLREKGQLTNSPKDIGPLMEEIMRDTVEEEKEFIQKTLYQWAIKKVQRSIVGGVPQWYKDKLLQDQFKNV